MPLIKFNYYLQGNSQVQSENSAVWGVLQSYVCCSLNGQGNTRGDLSRLMASGLLLW